MQTTLFGDDIADFTSTAPFKTQLLKWVGNKQRFAHKIAAYSPKDFTTLHEPFFGSGAVSATVSPKHGRGSDVFGPLVGLWQTLKNDPAMLKQWYSDRWHRVMDSHDKIAGYEAIKASYNANPNPADLLFLCRSCYGGVVRFRQADGYMSTPCGIHRPINPSSFALRTDIWAKRLAGVDFDCVDYQVAMARAQPGHLVYCDPPYSHTQSILYGAQGFSLKHLLKVIAECKNRGVFVALSIDGTKKSGNHICDIAIPMASLNERSLSTAAGQC